LRQTFIQGTRAATVRCCSHTVGGWRIPIELPQPWAPIGGTSNVPARSFSVRSRSIYNSKRAGSVIEAPVILQAAGRCSPKTQDSVSVYPRVVACFVLVISTRPWLERRRSIGTITNTPALPATWPKNTLASKNVSPPCSPHVAGRLIAKISAEQWLGRYPSLSYPRALLHPRQLTNL